MTSSSSLFSFTALCLQAANGCKKKTGFLSEPGIKQWVEDGIARPPAGGLADPFRRYSNLKGCCLRQPGLYL